MNKKLELIEAFDFSLIKDYYQLDFPLCEQKSLTKINQMLDEKKYHLFLLKDDIIRSYVLGYIKNNYFWMDYIAVIKCFRNQGYGKKTLDFLKKKFDYIILEVDISDGVEGSVSSLREQFYKSKGAKRIDIPYELPTSDGSYRMNLFIIGNNINKLDLKKFIEEAVSYIHSDFSHTKEIINKYINLI